MTSLEVQY